MLSCGDAKGRGGRLSYELFETTGLAQYEIENFENLYVIIFLCFEKWVSLMQK